MKILITGANGYIGTHLVKKCIDSGYNVVAVDIKNDVIDSRAIYKKVDIFDINTNFNDLFQDIDVLIHLAWRNGFVHNDISHIEDLDSHYMFLKKAIDSGIKYISCLGSMHEVGYHVGAIDENTPCNPLSLYGVAKNALRQAIMIYANGKDVNFHWLRGYYIVGDDLRSNSIFGKILKSVNSGKKVFPLNSGKIKYDFISIYDLCNQIVCASVQKKINGIINICSGKPVSLGERVEKFISDNNLNIKLEYGAFPDRTYDSPIVYGDATKINKILDMNK